MEAHIILNLKFTYYIISAMKERIIVNHKFTNYIKFIIDKTGVYPKFIMMQKLVEKNVYKS